MPFSESWGLGPRETKHRRDGEVAGALLSALVAGVSSVCSD